MTRQLTAVQAAYVAGAIDGEGCITIRRESPNPSAGKRSPQFQFVVKLTNTYKPWIDLLHEWLGGVVYQINGLGARNRKVCWDLRLRAPEARSVLMQAMPYMVIKRRQADLMLRYFELSERRRKESRPAIPVPADIIAAQEALYQEYKTINQRGITASTNMRGAPLARVCSVDGCDLKHYGRGYCLRHYHKFVARGGPTLYEKRCVVCDREFMARRSDAETCSKVCGDRRQYIKNRALRLSQAALRRKKKSPE